MKRFFLYAGLSLAVAAGGAAAALLAIGHGPLEEKMARWKSSPAARACIDVTISQLRSPSSFHLIEVTERKDPFGTEVQVAFEAVNGFNAPLRDSAECEANERGLLVTAVVIGEWLEWPDIAQAVGRDRVVAADSQRRRLAEDKETEFELLIEGRRQNSSR